MDYSEEQTGEIEALLSIYEGELEGLFNKCHLCQLNKVKKISVKVKIAKTNN
jgi:hypothetical protein